MSLAAFRFTNRARPIVELGIGDVRAGGGQAQWDSARWDTEPSRWAGTEPTWLDVTCDVFEVRFEYGRRRVTDRFVAGLATILVDNTSGWADPNAVDAPGVLTVRPGRSIRVSVWHAVHGYRVLWRGFVDAMTPTYLPTGTDTVELSCVDALGEVNRAKLVPVDPPVGDGDTASIRTDRILDAVGWPLVKRDVAASSEALVASSLGGQVADLLGQTADSAGGAVFGDREARVAFRNRDWQTFIAGTPPDGTVGNVGAADVCPIRWERPYDRADIATRAIIGRDLETAVVRDDPAGIAKFGIEPFERTDLLTKQDSSLVILADRVLRVRGAATAPRVRSVSLDARTSPAALDLMTTVDPYLPSRYRCRLVEDRGLVFDEEYFATGVAHVMTPTLWSLELNLDLAEPFAATAGAWDVGLWDRALWAASAADLLDEVRLLIGANT